MKSDDELWEICLDIYNELYEEATPSADFNQLKEGKFNKEKSENDDPHPYKDYFLQEERQREIVDKHVEKHDLSEHEESKITTEIYLGCSPVGTKAAWRGEENEADETKMCVTCGENPAIEARVPWGKDECEKCREKTGDCKKCGVNRNDCCC